MKGWTQKMLDELTYTIIGCAIEVNKQIGPGLLESLYEKCLIFELNKQGLLTASQQTVPLVYKGHDLETNLRLDILVENQIIVEVKATDKIHPIHEATLLTYMKLLEKPKGIIINFNCTNIVKEGQKTLVNEHYQALPKDHSTFTSIRAKYPNKSQKIKPNRTPPQ